MPANLPPEYFQAERIYRQAKSPAEKIEALKEMIRCVPHHKGTEKLMVDLKRRLAKLQEQATARAKTARSPFPDYIPKMGAGQIAFVGPPNSGKSSLLGCLSNAQPVIAEYPFSTISPTVGMMPFEDVQIQLLDLPPIAEETDGWVYNLIRQADAILLVISLASPSPEEELSDTLAILKGKKIRFTGNIEQKGEGTLPAALACTHLDIPATDEVFASLRQMFQKEFPLFAVSTITCIGLAALSSGIFHLLGIVRVYTKKPGQPFIKTHPFILRKGSTVLDLAFAVHNDIGKNFQYARVWGSTQFEGQRVERTHQVQDGDIIEIHA